MKQNPSCRVCGKRKVIYLCDTINNHSATRVIQNYKCLHCGSVFVGNEITSSELGVAYSTLNATVYYKEIKKENFRKFSTAKTFLEKSFKNKSIKLIDVGGGNGSFLQLLHDHNFNNLYIHEINDDGLEDCKHILRDSYFDDDYKSIPSNKFDVVTALDVLEHVISPSDFTKQLARILTPDGILYFHTPVVSRIDKIMHNLLRIPILKSLGVTWQRGRTSIFHLENYTPESLKEILLTAGFTDVTIWVKNELSWPVSRYVRVYLIQKLGLPLFFTKLLTPFFYPLLKSSFLNSNKAIVTAIKKPH